MKTTADPRALGDTDANDKYPYYGASRPGGLKRAARLPTFSAGFSHILTDRRDGVMSGRAGPTGGWAVGELQRADRWY